MKMKNTVLVGALALSLSAFSFALAQPVKQEQQNSTHQSSCHNKKMHFLKMVPQAQRKEFQAWMKASHQQLLPMFKERRALQLQLTGLLATPGVQWSTVSKLVDKINAVKADITTTMVKNRLEAVEKFGIVLPPPHAFKKMM